MEKNQRRFTDVELGTIKALFKDNDAGLKILRKVFLPTFDYNAPIGQTVDLWMTLNIMDKSPMDREIQIIARNQLITHVEQQLLQLQYLANEKEETKEEVAEKAKKNSSK